MRTQPSIERIIRVYHHATFQIGTVIEVFSHFYREVKDCDNSSPVLLPRLRVIVALCRKYRCQSQRADSHLLGVKVLYVHRKISYHKT